ncbi:hypothetical protein PQ465_17820 [Sphingobacterium oryzagri]|uniref:DUF4157 domain-containing protein n=1 Tax=Sphingobacterium oryzagri TaxID=3025669 RepID=A0ABY7WHW5_9SPHI|nr:hypothetical protein [Sphingobacterium sp. KACC 22765]WDF68142.1 hypothetical protein PQ465_17820 [Sphingobacterium sp. KACC 22765]
MHGVLIVSWFWTNFFSGGRAVAITIFPFIFVSRSDLAKDNVLLNHERIHLQQALELLVLPFYIFYLLEFCLRYVQHKNFNKAYFALSFEQEAYAFQADLGYLRRRKLWAFRRYLKK